MKIEECFIWIENIVAFGDKFSIGVAVKVTHSLTLCVPFYPAPHTTPPPQFLPFNATK